MYGDLLAVDREFIEHKILDLVAAKSTLIILGRYSNEVPLEIRKELRDFSHLESECKKITTSEDKSSP
ncbi:MAG: hypothetical protein KKF39_03865 [Nanoarchaeota archaeon]|nr:hypothetical protein [Nanoarchaeota archaeon]